MRKRKRAPKTTEFSADLKVRWRSESACKTARITKMICRIASRGMLWTSIILALSSDLALEGAHHSTSDHQPGFYEVKYGESASSDRF